MAAVEEAAVTAQPLDTAEGEKGTEEASAAPAAASSHKLVKLPLSRVKALMKCDPDVALASLESVFIICKATELFIESMAADAYVYAQRGKRKTLQRRDIDQAVDAVDEFAFLEGTLD
ncbi:DNA polymerase epsilon subunit 4 [Hyperolius riggenbachi]|uniref:DNA polymerase epsilon subunit 4 n=1 Tax=Hyperolius riggenbachi TaxID=752182 RepID=UPI0035A3BC02